jgi:hypothetical protein
MRFARLVASAALVAALVPSASAQVEQHLLKRFQSRAGTAGSHLVTFPYSDFFEDIANSSQPGGDKCDISDSGPDGVIDADDVICRVWGDGDPALRIGTFTLQTFDPSTCAWQSRTATRTGFVGVQFLGAPRPFTPGIGYMVAVGRDFTGVEQDFDVEFVDTGIPAWPGQLTERPTCPEGAFAAILLHVPWDVCFDTADEALCGDEGVDWWDADGNRFPDACTTEGVWRPLPRHAAAVSRYAVEEEVWGPAWISRTTSVQFSRQVFTGINFNLVRGEALLFQQTTPGDWPFLWDPCRDAGQ